MPDGGRLVSVVTPWPGAPPPLAAFRRGAGRPHAFFRHAAGGPRDLSRWSFLATDPIEVLSIGGARRGLSRDPWDAIASSWPRTVERIGPHVPFSGGFAGSFGYEMRSSVEDVPRPRTPPHGFPALFLARYDAVAAWDMPMGRAFLAGTGPSEAAARRAISALARRIVRAPDPVPRQERDAAWFASPEAACSEAAYRAKVATVRRRIRAGDLFQANLSQRFDARFDGDPVALFVRLAETAQAPFCTYVEIGGGRRILSASPERFLRLSGTLAETRPMKGTRPRGGTPREDRALRAALAASVKDGAELAMIVDLSRNDLGRVCRPGTVRVRDPRRIESYPTVHQAVGIVTGRLERGRTGVDLVRAAFPPGSVTGAPKVEALRWIDRLEGEARGPYCGALGWLDEGGDMDLSVAIRTLCLAGRRASFRVGGGITLLSEPEAERVETLDKAVVLVRALASAASRIPRGAPHGARGGAP